MEPINDTSDSECSCNSEDSCRSHDMDRRARTFLIIFDEW